MMSLLWQNSQTLGDPASIKSLLGLNRLGQSFSLNMVWSSPLILVKNCGADLHGTIQLGEIGPIWDYPVSLLLDLSAEIFVLTHVHGPGDGHGHGGVHLGHVGGRGAEDHCNFDLICALNERDRSCRHSKCIGSAAQALEQS